MSICNKCSFSKLCFRLSYFQIQRSLLQLHLLLAVVSIQIWTYRSLLHSAWFHVSGNALEVVLKLCLHLSVLALFQKNLSGYWIIRDSLRLCWGSSSNTQDTPTLIKREIFLANFASFSPPPDIMFITIVSIVIAVHQQPCRTWCMYYRFCCKIYSSWTLLRLLFVLWIIEGSSWPIAQSECISFEMSHNK